MIGKCCVCEQLFTERGQRERMRKRNEEGTRKPISRENFAKTLSRGLRSLLLIDKLARNAQLILCLHISLQLEQIKALHRIKSINFLQEFELEAFIKRELI